MLTIACPSCKNYMQIDGIEENTEWECPSCGAAFLVRGSADHPSFLIMQNATKQLSARENRRPNRLRSQAILKSKMKCTSTRSSDWQRGKVPAMFAGKSSRQGTSRHKPTGSCRPRCDFSVSTKHKRSSKPAPTRLRARETWRSAASFAWSALSSPWDPWRWLMEPAAALFLRGAPSCVARFSSSGDSCNPRALNLQGRGRGLYPDPGELPAIVVLLPIQCSMGSIARV